MFSTTRGHIATCQLLGSVAAASTDSLQQSVRWDMPTICRQYVRWDMGWYRGFVCRKFLWAYSFWGQWCVSQCKYTSRYGRDQHVGCVTYESRIHTTHAWNLPQIEWSKFQRNVSEAPNQAPPTDQVHPSLRFTPAPGNTHFLVLKRAWPQDSLQVGM